MRELFRGFPQIYWIMCGSYCLISDELHERAMFVSKCDCMELSTFQEGESPVKVIGSELQWHTEGDFCKVLIMRALSRFIL